MFCKEKSNASVSLIGSTAVEDDAERKTHKHYCFVCQQNWQCSVPFCSRPDLGRDLYELMCESCFSSSLK